MTKALFTSPGTTQDFVVPDWVSSVTVKVWGAAGGGRGTEAGGGGGFVTGSLAATPGETLTLYVAKGGIAGDGQYGANGGGASAILRGATPLVISPGGGGSPSSGIGPLYSGGGGTTGQTGTGAAGGGPGTQASVGSGGVGSRSTGIDGNGHNGGDGGGSGAYTPAPAWGYGTGGRGAYKGGDTGGSGGGGGYYGGGGGGCHDSGIGHGGGGGSAFVPDGGSTTAASGSTPGGSDDTDRAGYAGGVAGGNGDDGYIVIEYVDAPPVTIGGVVRDNTGAFCQRTVAAYLRSSKALVSVGLSNAITGEFSLSVPTAAEHFVIALDDDAGTDFNALIFDRITPV